MRFKNTSRYPVMRPNALILVGVFFIMAAAVVLPFRSVQSGSRPASSSRNVSAQGPARVSQINTQIASNPVLARSIFEPFLPLPQSPIASISTYDTDCSTPKTDFNLGDTVCAKATGVPAGLLFPWRVSWVDTAGFIRHSDSAIANDAATYTFTLPATTTSIINDQTVDNRGTWSANLTRSNGAILRTARFTVHETANPQADVFVQKLQRDANDQIHSGDNVAFLIVVGNAGPDTGSAVHLVDSVPSGATLVSFTQNSGPACSPSGSNDCTIATLVNGDRAEFTAIYNLGSIAPGTYETSATVSTTTPDSDNSNDTSTAQFVVQTGSGGVTCELTCPTSITVTANTVEGGQSGAHVSYPDPESSGTCGTITTSPASGSFFPVGTTIVTATSATGGGSCSFSVEVEDSNANVSISCPANKQATADANCGATISLGNPTTTGANVTITVSRSDGQPMYDCDTNGENCVRKTTDLPFPAGVTIVTWTATSHDTPGPYANPADEEAHRTGNASCQQTVTVDDVTPPTITAANQTASANANCQAPVPDFSTIATVSDNCACASSDTSQICDSRQDIVVTQDVAPGTLVGLGPHTIQLTANDGSSNNGGAGNSTTISVTFTVNDTTAPIITCPADITVGGAPGTGTCSATVSPGVATATDNCDSSPTVTPSRSDGRPITDPFSAGTTTITWTATDASGNSSTCQQTIIVVAPQLNSLGPANIWVGVKNSDDVGTRFDFLVEVFRNGTLVGSGELDNQASGSSGFNNAILRTIAITQSQSASFCPGNTMSIKLSVRAGPTGHVSGTARLWYNDSAANSRFSATINGSSADYFLRSGFTLATTAGPGPKATIDVLVNRNQNGNAWKPFGTWTYTF